MNNVIITGASGKIGLQLTCDLINDDYGVIAITRSKVRFVELLKNRSSNLRFDKLFICEYDLVNDSADVLVKFLNDNKLQPTSIIHLARSVDYAVTESDLDSSVNKFVSGFKLDIAIPYQVTMRIIQDVGTLFNNVIFISSMYGVVAPNSKLYKDFSNESHINYGVSKAAQIHLTKELAVRLAKRSIRVNCVSYGGVEGRVNEDFLNRYKSLVPQERMLQEKEVSGPIKFLLSDQSIGMTGHNLIYDGGWTIW